MPRFDVDQTSLIREWVVLGQVRAADPCTLRVVAELIREYAIQNKNFFSAPVVLRTEHRAWFPSGQRAGFGLKTV